MQCDPVRLQRLGDLRIAVRTVIVREDGVEQAVQPTCVLLRARPLNVRSLRNHSRLLLAEVIIRAGQWLSYHYCGLGWNFGEAQADARARRDFHTGKMG